MKGKRHKTEEIIRILRMADGGQTVEQVCREANICEQTFYRWRRKYGRMEMADAKRYKELENENTELKKMLADEMLKARVLEEALWQKSWRNGELLNTSAATMEANGSYADIDSTMCCPEGEQSESVYCEGGPGVVRRARHWDHLH
ncbi:MAG: transposase [Verrucomicrobiales bacterium]|nr:transposase [Verrucomicrobiales bacterium]